MTKRLVSTWVFSMVLFSVVASPVAMAFDGAQFSGQAKVSLHQARQIALSAYDGKIVGEELEKEKGGSGLRYSFDIERGDRKHEVGVDAKTGKVLENSLEGADSD